MPPSAPANKTLPLDRSEPAPPRVRKVAKSRVSLSRVVVGRAGDGEVWRYSMRFAASSSLARGVVWRWSDPLRGGVAALAVCDMVKEASAGGNNEFVTVAVQELWP